MNARRTFEEGRTAWWARGEHKAFSKALDDLARVKKR